MSDRIKVLIVDDIQETRDHLSKLLSFEADMDVVGVAASGAEAVERAVELMPDVVLMDINMPGMDGIAATELLATTCPTASVVMMSVQGEADYLRRSMLAGAREFLVKPFSSDELNSSIRQVWSRERDKASRIGASVAAATASHGANGGAGQVVAVFSPKGGVGRTTVAVNLAVAAATLGETRVALMDASLQFGDVGVLLNLNPKSKSITDLAREFDSGEFETIEPFMVRHSSGVQVLLAPPSPEAAEHVTAVHAKRAVERLRAEHDLTIVDCPATFNDSTLAILDEADVILTLVNLEITSIKNMRLFMEVTEHLGYGKDKVRIVLNRSDATLGIRVTDVENSIGRKIQDSIVSDGRSVVYALNRGVPFFLSNREAQVSQDVLRLATDIVGSERQAAAAAKTTTDKAAAKKSLFAWR